MSKNFVLVLVSIILAFGAIFWFTKEDAGAPANTDPNANLSSHTYGEGKSGVILIEYGDFQCPACGAYFPIVKALKEKYKEDITFQFLNFPLTQIHPNAMAAHRAAEAAAKQGKFWEMHDLLYQNQQSWQSSSAAVPIFEGYSQQLNLNTEQFKQDFASSEVNNLINADIQAGQAAGANSTPTFILNGKKLEDNPADQEAFDKLISDAIKNSSQ